MRRIYVRQQIFVLGFGVGIALAGIALLIYPTADNTGSLLPEWLRLCLHLTYLLGGLALATGVGFAVARLEAAGHILVSALFAVSVYLSIQLTPDFKTVITSCLTLVPLSIGSALRFYFLMRVGHD